MPDRDDGFPEVEDEPGTEIKRTRVETKNDLPTVQVEPDVVQVPEIPDDESADPGIVSGRIRVLGDPRPVTVEMVPDLAEGMREESESYESLDAEAIEEVSVETETVEEPGEEPVVEAGPEEPSVEDMESLDEEAIEEVSVETETVEEISEAEEVFASSPPPPRPPASIPPPVKKPLPDSLPPPPLKKPFQDSVPPPPPPATVAEQQVDVAGNDAPSVLAIPEDDVRRDYKVAVEREALEAAAAEVIPPEFMVEEGDGPPAPPRARPVRPRRPRKWYEEIFGEEYLMCQPKLSSFQYRREIDFVEKGLGLRPGAMVLDLACGAGLHATGMSKRGYQVVGLDLSVAMLAMAGERAQEEGVKINFLHGDMRDLQFGPTFDGVYCIGTSFGYFDEENNIKVVEGVHRALKPGGIFLLEVENRDFVMRDQPNLLWYEGDGYITMEETHFDFITSRLSINRTMLMDEGGKKVFKYSMRVYSLHELGIMLHNVGFSVFKVGGHRAASGAFLGEESPKIIVQARKRTEEG
jgi:SAM-dependent methyltransferase